MGDDTLGQRAIFGVLVPYFNTVVEPELAALQPAGVTNQTARFELNAEVLEQVTAAAVGLAACDLSAIAIALSTESIPGGLAVLEQGANEVRERIHKPVFTASHATQDALRAISARRIAVVTPFDDEANHHVRDSLEANGFEVTCVAGLACPSIETIGQTPLPVIRAVFEGLDHSEAEAIVQIGTGLPVLGLIDDLEKSVGKTVVACNAALYWQCLRSAGVDDAIPGWGRLFAEL